MPIYYTPTAPGLPYVFRLPNKPKAAPLILLAGDCTGGYILYFSLYLFLSIYNTIYILYEN